MERKICKITLEIRNDRRAVKIVKIINKPELRGENKVCKLRKYFQDLRTLFDVHLTVQKP